jgi:hypothetical protein
MENVRSMKKKFNLKTWKLAGRPDKAGKRTEITIGLCECCGKTF